MAHTRQVPIRQQDIEKYRLRDGDILITRVNGSADIVGRFNLVEGDLEAIYCDHFIRMRVNPERLDSKYLALFGESEFTRTRIADLFISTAGQKTVNQGHIASLPIAVPPLAEQPRIVARVDELMRLCDALEANGRLEAEQHARLLDALLGSLTSSTNPEELATNWQRVAAHFDLLLDRPEAVDHLEETIAQLAIRGLLVQQRASDEPSSRIFRCAQHAMAQSQTRCTTASAQGNPLIGDSASPFPSPSGWLWVRFGAVVQVSGGVTLGRRSRIAKPVSRPYLRVANVQRRRLDLAAVKEVVIDESEIARFQLQTGDLLITEGGDWDKVGRTAIWRNEIAACLHQNHVFKARGLADGWCPEWAELYLNSDIARSYFAASAKQTTNLASINMTELKACPFPLPPVAEQRRIVARVEQLRRLCAELRGKLVAAREVQTRVADALVQQVVRGQA